MRQRCLNPKNSNYADYGGRGITVCERWLNFTNFLADMGVRPEGLTLGRRDNNRGYSPDNCGWETYTEQNRNTRLTPRREPYANLVIRTHGLVKQVRDRKQGKGWGNQFMRKVRRPASEDFPGVYRTGTTWIARICINGKQIYLGSRATAFEAYLLRVEAAREYSVPLLEGDRFLRKGPSSAKCDGLRRESA
jgi:hypothetical protein